MTLAHCLRMGARMIVRSNLIRERSWLANGIVILAAIGCPDLSGQTMLRLSGSLSTPEGKAVEKAEILVHATRQNSVGLVFEARTSPDNSGRFEVSVPEAGRYAVCVRAAGFLNPCVWPELTSPYVDAAPATVASIAMKLAPSVPVRVRVDDFEQVLRSPISADGSASFDAGIVTPRGRFVPFELSSADHTWKEYVIEAPEDVDVDVVFGSTGADLFDKDDGGKKVERSHKVKVKVNRGQAKKFAYQVRKHHDKEKEK